MGNYITDIKLLSNSPSVGKPVSESPLLKQTTINILGFGRMPSKIVEADMHTILQEGDILRVSGNVREINEIQSRQGIQILRQQEWMQGMEDTDNLVLAEAMITPGSELEGKSLSQTKFKDRYHSFALAIRSRNHLFQKRIHKTKLRAGDVLLLTAKKDVIDQYQQRQTQDEIPFLIISEIEKQQLVNKRKTLLVSAIIAGVVLAASFNILSIMASSIIGVTLLVLLGLIDMQELYKAIDWKVIFLVAGSIALGIALEKTQTAKILAEDLIFLIGGLGPIAMVSALYLITSLLTEMISNAASAVLLAPIAISAAEVMHVDAKPFLLAIMFAASASFMTPVGYQTNTMVYAAGNYKYTDFFRVGAPLNLLYWILASILIPLYFNL